LLAHVVKELTIYISSRHNYMNLLAEDEQVIDEKEKDNKYKLLEELLNEKLEEVTIKQYRILVLKEFFDLVVFDSN
ncbi:22064_t:CDS:2, partial [Cetraspora pellucida]